MTTLDQKTYPLIVALKPSETQDFSLQSKAWEAFSKQGLPGPKHEAFKYFKLGGLYQKSWPQKELIIDEKWIKQVLKTLTHENYMVTYNGHFLKEFSHYPDFEGKLIVQSLSEAMKNYAPFFTAHYTSQLSDEQDPFALLALATLQEGLFIYAPKQMESSKELLIIELSSSNEPQTFTSPIFISLGQESNLKLSTLAQSKGESEMLALSYKGFHLAKGANLHHTHGCYKAESYRLESVKVEQMRDSTYTQVMSAFSTPKMRQSLLVDLNQEGSNVDLSGVLALSEKEQGHVHVLVKHKAPHCQSSQLYKHLLNDESLSSFEGKIWVEKVAQKTDAYQLNQNCLLSNSAQAYSKPNLEIFADDVKASHGSTTGQLDNEQLFYLLSRGLSKAQAQQILLRGFCEEVLEKSQNAVLHKFLHTALLEYLKEAL